MWPLARDLDLRDLRGNVGAGVRVLFPFGPVRLDWAWVLDPQDGEQRSRWVFALGHAFTAGVVWGLVGAAVPRLVAGYAVWFG